MTVTEVFANFPATTVPAGASGTIPSGGTDTWLVTGSAGFPSAVSGITQFHVADTALDGAGELVTVTNMSGPGNTTWAVVRGAENTTPVAHDPGFTITQVLTAGWLSGVVSGTSGVVSGGTGGTQATPYGVLTGGTSATSPFQQVTGTGTSGQVLTSKGAGTLPSWQAPVAFPITVPKGGTGGTQVTAYGLLAGGTSATAPFQQVAGLGTAGQALTSNGAGSLPSWQQPFTGLMEPLASPVTSSGSPYSAAVGQYVPVDTTGGNVTVNLPSGPADKAIVGIKHVLQGGTNAVTWVATGGAVINKTGGGTQGTLPLLSQGVIAQYAAAGSIWYVYSDDLPLGQLDARYVLDSSLPLSVGSGGSGGSQVTAYAVVTGGTSATSPLQQVASVGTLGQVLVSQGPGALPQWGTIAAGGGSSVSFPITVPEGGTGGTATTAYAVVAGGTTATAPFQAVTAGAGSAGFVLTSNGAGSLPSFQALAGGQLDSTSSHIQPLGTQAAGSGSLAAISTHVHSSTLTGWAETAVSGTIASGTTTSTIAVASGNVYNLTLSNTATCTFTLTTGTPSGTSSSVTVYLTQDSTGTRTVAWNNVTWLAGVAPAIASGAGAVTVLTFETFNAGSNWFGAQITGAPQIPVPLADLPAQAATTLGMFGDGSDGAATLDGTTATSGWASGPTSSAYTLSRDAQLTALQVNTGVTLNASGYRIHCQGQVSISSGGTISVAGHNASGATAGAVTGSGSNGGGRAGGNGGTAAGTAGTTGSGSPNGIGGAGGAGTGGAGASAGASTSLPGGWYRLPSPILNGGLYAFTVAQGINGGAGGGGGGGDGTNAGGGGGGGGGLLTVFAYSVVNNGTMTVAGGNGGNGAGSNSGGGGGGGGGAVLAYTLIPWNNAGTTIVSGGSAGTGGHANGSAGGSGSSVNIVLV